MVDQVSPGRGGMLAAVAEAVRKQPVVAAAYVYGSAAQGRATPISDMDVALLFMEDRRDPEERRLVASEVARSLVASMGEEARPDVRDVEDLPLAVRGAVATEGALAASNDEVRRVRFEAQTGQRYLDSTDTRRWTMRGSTAFCRPTSPTWRPSSAPW